MSTLKIAGTLLTCIVLLASAHTQAATIVLSGRSIAIAIPKGYCELGNSPIEEKMNKRTIQGIGSDNQLIKIFVECHELNALKNGSVIRVSNYGVITVLTQNSKIRILNDLTRQQFINQLSEKFSKTNSDRLMKVAEEHGRKFVEGYQSAEILGPLGIDVNGVYFGIAATFNDDTGQSIRSIGVTGATLLKDLVFSISINRVDNTSIDLRTLLSRNKSTMLGFVHANE
jgi:hypothetical protein